MTVQQSRNRAYDFLSRRGCYTTLSRCSSQAREGTAAQKIMMIMASSSLSRRGFASQTIRVFSGGSHREPSHYVVFSLELHCHGFNLIYASAEKCCRNVDFHEAIKACPTKKTHHMEKVKTSSQHGALQIFSRTREALQYRGEHMEAVRLATWSRTLDGKG